MYIHFMPENYHPLGIYFLYTQYTIIRNGDQRWALEFLENYQFPDADHFLILQGWELANLAKNIAIVVKFSLTLSVDHSSMKNKEKN